MLNGLNKQTTSCMIVEKHGLSYYPSWTLGGLQEAKLEDFIVKMGTGVWVIGENECILDG